MIVLNNVSFPFAARSRLLTYPFVTRALKFYYFFLANRFLLILVAQSLREKRAKWKNLKIHSQEQAEKTLKVPNGAKIDKNGGFGMRQ